MKRMTAKNYLQQVSKINAIIQNKLIEKEQWLSIATSTAVNSDGERVQSSGSQDKMANAVLKMIEAEKEIDMYVDQLVDIKKEVISTIETLPVAEYDLLHKVYIQERPLDEVADKLGKTYSWSTTVHGRALKHVQDILNERNSKDSGGC